ncbi:MAG: hypothetical protein ABIU54_07695 [Candidatus Eisenbacteria bacterium]
MHSPIRTAAVVLWLSCFGLTGPAAAEHKLAATDSVAIAPVAGPPLLSPLILDQDYGLGTTVVLDRLPDAKRISDLAYVSNLRHVILSLQAWPANFAALQSLGQVALPEGADWIVVLRGFPPSREQADMWNYLRARLRLVLVVAGPPADRSQIQQLNSIRSLERVIAEMDVPARTGFERLQRPLSFRIVMP